MFQYSLSELMLRILREYNEHLGLNNPPPTAQLYNSLALYIENVKEDAAESFNNLNGKVVTIRDDLTQLQDFVANDMFIEFRFTDNPDYTLVEGRKTGGWREVGKIYKQTAEQLQNKIEGSDSIVVDLNETGDKLEIHIDYEVLNKIERALLIPSTYPTEFELVGVDTDRKQQRVRLGDGLTYNELSGILEVSGGGGSAKPLYMHSFELSFGIGGDKKCKFNIRALSTQSEEFTSTNIISSLDSSDLIIVKAMMYDYTYTNYFPVTSIIFTGYSFYGRVFFPEGFEDIQGGVVNETTITYTSIAEF